MSEPVNSNADGVASRLSDDDLELIVQMVFHRVMKRFYVAARAPNEPPDANLKRTPEAQRKTSDEAREKVRAHRARRGIY